MVCTRYSSGKEAAYQKADIGEARKQASVAAGRETCLQVSSVQPLLRWGRKEEGFVGSVGLEQA